MRLATEGTVVCLIIVLGSVVNGSQGECQAMQRDNLYQIMLSDGSSVCIKALVAGAHGAQRKRQAAEVTLWRYRKGVPYSDKGPSIWDIPLGSVEYVPDDDRRYALVKTTEDHLFVFFMWNARYFTINVRTGQIVDKGEGDDTLRDYANLVPLRLLFVYPSTGRLGTDQELKVSKRSVMADPSTEESDVLALMETLWDAPPTSDEATLLMRLANSTRYSDTRRRRAVLLLFDRHVHSGMELGQVASLLANPVWLKKDAVSVVRDLAGKIPIRMVAGETVFVIAPQLPRDDVSAVYLRVQDSPSVESLYNALSGQESEAAALKITAMGMFSRSEDDRRLLTRQSAQARDSDSGKRQQ